MGSYGASEVMWKQQYRVELGRKRRQKWRSPTNGVGNSAGDGKIKWQSKGRRSRSLGPRAGIGEAFERVILPPCGLGLGDALQFPKEESCGCFVGFEHQRRVQFEGCVAKPLRTITAILPGSKWSCSLLRIVLQDALSEVTKN